MSRRESAEEVPMYDWIPGALYKTATLDDGTRWRCIDYSDTGKGIPLVWLVQVRPEPEFESDWMLVADIVRMVPDENDEATAAVIEARERRKEEG